MHLVQALPDSVSLSHDDYEWVQTLEYEHVPFRCRKFHTHGHLFCDCPINPPPCKPSDFSSTPDGEGFIKVQNRRRHNKESPPPNPKPPSQPPLPPSTSNNFEILDTPISDTPLSEAIPKAPLSSRLNLALAILATWRLTILGIMRTRSPPWKMKMKW